MDFILEISGLVPYLAAAVAVGLAAVGCGTGMGITAGQAIAGMSRQPSHHPKILKTMLIGQAVAESPVIFALVIALVMITTAAGEAAPAAEAAAIFGAGLSIGISAMASGLSDGFVGGMACKGVARQPEQTGRVTVTMLISQALCESPVIFGLVIALILLFGAPLEGVEEIDVTIIKSAGFIMAGLTMGLGACGAALGIGTAVSTGLYATATYPKSYGPLLRTMLIGAAVTESTSIFSLVTAFLLIFGTG